MQLPRRIMGAWNEGCRYMSMAIYSLLPHCILSVPAGFPSPAAIWMALCLFGYLCGLLTVHFKVTNPGLITKLPLSSLSVCTVTFLSVVRAQCELILGFHLCVEPGLHILCSELDWKPLLPGWTEELKIHASAAGEGTPLCALLQRQGWGRSPGPALAPHGMPNSASQADVASEHHCQGGTFLTLLPEAGQPRDAAMGS